MIHNLFIPADELHCLEEVLTSLEEKLAHTRVYKLRLKEEPLQDLRLETRSQVTN